MASAGKVGVLPSAPSKPGNEKHQSQLGNEPVVTVSYKSSASTGIPKDILSATSLGPAQNQRCHRSLLSLCVSCLGCHLHDIIDEIHLIAPILPPSVKIQLIAIARRRGLLCDEVLVPLADEAWELLDVSGSDVTDAGICQVAKVCPLLKAADISSLTAQSIRALVHHCPGLETLRCGGTHLSNTAARLALPYLLPGLNVSKEVEDWEDLETEAVGRGAQSLQWIVWPSIDEKSKGTVEAQCPRMVVNPKRTKSYKQPTVPREALSNVSLDEPFVEDIDPSTWAVRFSHVPAASSKFTGAADDIPIAERFRLAFVARDERLAPKRAKNWRQNQRRAEKVWLSSNVEAKARYLAAGLTKG